MTLFDRYIAGQVLRPLAIALLIALGVFVVSRLISLMDLILGTEGPLKVMIQIIGYLVPHYLSLALPMSLLLGVMIGFSKMGRDGETDALQAAGLGLGRQARGAIVIGVVVALITALMHGYFRPYARYAYQAVVSAVTNAAVHASVRAGVFAQIDDVTFLVQGIGGDGVSVSRVFVYQPSDDGSAAVVAARDGGLIRPGPLAPPVLRLFDGVRLSGGGRSGAAAGDDRAGPSVLRFGELRMVLGQEQAMMFRPRGNDEREMTITELWQRRADPPPGVKASDLVAELHGRIVRVLSVPLLPLFAICLGLGRKRSDRFAGIAIGLIALIAYEQVLDFGENAAESARVSTLVGLWLPFAAFAALVLILFTRTATRLPSGRAWSAARVLQALRPRRPEPGTSGGAAGIGRP